MSDLFGDDRGGQNGQNGATVPARTPNHGGVRPGAGRPKGALSRVNQDLREYLVNLTGREAIVPQWRLASIDPLSADVHKLARFWGCTPIEAVDRIGAAFARVSPNVYPRLGSMEIKAPGAPSGGGEGFIDYLMDELGLGEQGTSILDLPFEEIPDGRKVREVERHGADANAELPTLPSAEGGER